MRTSTIGPSSAGAAAADLVYILAASHSGSTLLGMLLASHPEICTVGELKLGSLGDPDSYRCSCRELLADCQFWQQVSLEMSRRGHPFDVRRAGTDFSSIANPAVARLLRPLHRGRALEAVRDAALGCIPAWRSGHRLWRARTVELARAICAVHGKRIIVDSSKTAVRLKYLLRVPGLNVRVVRLVRDGRAVALTYADPENFADASAPGLRWGGTGQGHRHERLSLTAAATEWRRSNEEAGQLLRGLPRDRWTEVRYERLCDDTLAELHRLYRFIGVAPVGAVPDYRATANHVIGNGMRMDTTQTVRLDDRWRRVLDAEALAVIDAAAGDLNRSLGYA